MTTNQHAPFCRAYGLYGSIRGASWIYAIWACDLIAEVALPRPGHATIAAFTQWDIVWC